MRACSPRLFPGRSIHSRLPHGSPYLTAATSFDREYTPARSADRHRPDAHCRRLSILSPAVTATGTTFWAALLRPAQMIA